MEEAFPASLFDTPIQEEQFKQDAKRVRQPTPQLSLFDVQNIEGMDAGTVPALRYSQQVIDEALTLGANDRNSRLIICAFFQKDHTPAENAAFLREHYGTNGAGFYLDGRQYAVWYDREGFRISMGDTVQGSMTMTFSWEEAARRVRELLDLGRYMPWEELLRVNVYERTALAERLLFVARDLSEEGREKGFLPSFRTLSGAFDHESDQIVSLMEESDSLKALTDEWHTFTDAYREDRDLLRFHYHRPTELLRQLEDLQREPVRFSVAEEYAPQPQRFISLDEIDKLLRGPDAERGTEDRLAVYAFFLAHPDAKEREKALRNMRGVSGSYGGNDNISYDPKGVSFSHGDMTKPYAKIEWNWTKVRQRIETLIEQNRFLSQVDREHMPEYERKQIAASIVAAYRDAPEGFIRPFNGDPILHYSENVTAVQKLLRDPIQVKAIANELSLLTERTSPDDRQYEDRQNAVRQLAAYRLGEFSLFGEKRELVPEPIEESDLDRAKWLINAYCQAEFGSYADFSDLSHVGLAYTTDEADTYEISVFADLEQNRIVYRIDDQVVREVRTNSLAALNEYLEALDFGAMISDAQDAYESQKAAEAPTPSPEPRPYAVGDTVYLDNAVFQITNVTDMHVELLDHTLVYPVFRTENKERFEHLIRQDARNTMFVPPTQPSEEQVAAEEEMKLNSIVIDLRPSWERKEPKPEPVPVQPVSNERIDFRITDDHLGEGGAKTKFQRNVAAIRTLKQIESDYRLATLEEQEILSQYVGWGGLPDAFDETKSQWSEEYAELRELLTPEEYRSARASTLNAHYTSPVVIRAMYQAIESMGFHTGPGTSWSPPAGSATSSGCCPRECRAASFTAWSWTT